MPITSVAVPRTTGRRPALSRWLRMVAVGALAGALVVGIPPGDLARAKPHTSVTTLKVKPSSSPRIVERSDRAQVSQLRRGVVPDRVVAETAETDTAGYQTVGVTWAADSSGTAPDVQVRNRLRSGGWSEWQTISEPEPARTNDGRLATDPVWVGDSTAVQVRVLGDATSRPHDVQATLIDSPAVAADSEPQTLAATSTADLYPRPAVVTRAGWGADESLRCTTPDIDATIAGVVVHHTAGSNSYTSAESASIIRGIYAYHTKTLGWCDIGYNFLVDKYGKVYEGRAGGMDFPVHGAHATEWNTNTMGVSFMGNYETALPPAVMLESGAKIIAWKLDAFQRNAIGTVALAGKTVNIIFRHGDVMSTACPGKHVTAQMDALRRNVAGKLGAHSVIYNAWQRRGGESGSLGSPHVSERFLGEGRVAGFTGNTGTDLYWHPSRGDKVVFGAIMRRYNSVGATRSRLGWPTSDEVAGPLPGTRLNSFTGGRVVWRSDTGASPLWGSFNSLWNSQAVNVGVPVSGEYNSPVRDGLVKQNFSNGKMFWSSGAGPYAVYGSIWRLYRSFGDEGSALGAPRSSEYGVTNGRATNFEYGTIYYTGSVGSREVHGAIIRRYRELGEVDSRLGFPTSNEYEVPGGRANDFQGGRITWTRATGELTVSYS